MAEAFFGSYQLLTEMRETLTTEVFEFATFEQVPHSLLRVQIRGIAWQALQMEPFGRSLREKLFDHLGAMDWGTIPNDEEFAFDLAQQHT